MTEPSELLTGKEAAEYLGVTPAMISRLRAFGDIGQLVLGRYWMYSKEELDHYRATRKGKRGRPSKPKQKTKS